MKIYNNNSAFGDFGPFDIDAPTFRLACHMIANEMRGTFEQFADDQENKHTCDAFNNPMLPDLVVRDKRIAKMRREFLDGLTEVTE